MTINLAPILVIHRFPPALATTHVFHSSRWMTRMTENRRMIPRSYHAQQALLPDLVDGAALYLSA
jgi:hypothetical protein